jgi:elongation factor G
MIPLRELGQLSVFSSLNLALYHQAVGLNSQFLGTGTAMNNGLDRSFYRETVRDSGVGDGKVIRQRGGVGVYAHVRVEVRALSPGQGTVLAWNAGLNIPAKFASAVTQGIQDAMNAGVSSGLEVTDVCVSVVDGSYHEGDSTADAFREAAGEAAAEATRQARPIILEALSLVTVTVPPDFAEAVEATVASYGGEARVTPGETPARTLSASLPASNVTKLIAELLQISRGHASISIRSAGFQPRPEPPDTVEQWVGRR